MMNLMIGNVSFFFSDFKANAQVSKRGLEPYFLYVYVSLKAGNKTSRPGFKARGPCAKNGVNFGKEKNQLKMTT